MQSRAVDPVLSLRGVAKSFGSLRAVDDVSFEIRPGESVGFLGPNGAGKTTTLSMITGLVKPDGGEIRIRGERVESDVSPVKRSLGLVPQDLALYEELNGWDNLCFFGSLYDLAGAELAGAMERALRFVGLLDRAKDKVKTYSGGMRRRLNLGVALLHDPEILLLDEPTVGVDPQSRNSIFDNITLLRAGGKTIVYTTHYMEEVERLCDRVIIIDHGKVVADDDIESLKRLTDAAQNRLTLELVEPLPDSLLADLRNLPGVISASLATRRLSIEVGDLSADAVVVLRHLEANHCRWTSLATGSPSLESIFLTLTGNQLRDS